MIIDGWVRDPQIRRDVLIGLVLLLATVAIIVETAVASGGSGLAGLLTTPVGKIVLGTGTVGAGTAGVLRYRGKRQQSRAAATAAAHPPAGHHHITSFRNELGEPGCHPTARDQNVQR